jgi:hypothetical protein
MRPVADSPAAGGLELRAFDRPEFVTIPPAAAMIATSAGDDGLDTLRSKALPDRFTVVTAIRIDCIGLLPRASPSRGRNKAEVGGGNPAA